MAWIVRASAACVYLDDCCMQTSHKRSFEEEAAAALCGSGCVGLRGCGRWGVWEGEHRGAVLEGAASEREGAAVLA
jgi:hypothetical protein